MSSQSSASLRSFSSLAVKSSNNSHQNLDHQTQEAPAPVEWSGALPLGGRSGAGESTDKC